jgi:hypothetical protein
LEASDLERLAGWLLGVVKIIFGADGLLCEAEAQREDTLTIGGIPEMNSSLERRLQGSIFGLDRKRTATTELFKMKVTTTGSNSPTV